MHGLFFDKNLTMQFRLVRVIEIIAVQCETKVVKILKNHFAERTLSF